MDLNLSDPAWICWGETTPSHEVQKGGVLNGEPRSSQELGKTGPRTSQCPDPAPLFRNIGTLPLSPSKATVKWVLAGFAGPAATPLSLETAPDSLLGSPSLAVPPHCSGKANPTPSFRFWHSALGFFLECQKRVVLSFLWGCLVNRM